ncbi:hypothetical protein ATG66_2984 [Vibrio sp. ES.051]|uniref:hypothetical protein n=1 Tax=Vibrio sp. ES.051 TaxID=1761909 RepID=UPI000BF6D570|nr:hypothetical protein [Vibrio sp. ES.051]PFG45899.1 hypothetical protein ATG66_2984 [Vibrio sp. ES.051]
MILSTLQFFITILLVVVCARAMSLSEGDIPVLALMIPALWMLPQGGFAGLVLLGAMMAFGATLSMQPIALSVGMLILFPLLMVVFSRRSSLGVLLTTGLIVVTLQVGLMVTQQGGKLDGSAWITVVQTILVLVMWWSITHWTPSNKHSWWPMLLLVPLWIADLPYAVLVALCLTGMLSSIEALVKHEHSIRWSKLLCWTLPTVGFAALVVSPTSEVPNPVFVVWLCLLGTAWMTDYILRSNDEQAEL